MQRPPGAPRDPPPLPPPTKAPARPSSPSSPLLVLARQLVPHPPSLRPPHVRLAVLPLSQPASSAPLLVPPSLAQAAHHHRWYRRPHKAKNGELRGQALRSAPCLFCSRASLARGAKRRKGAPPRCCRRMSCKRPCVPLAPGTCCPRRKKFAEGEFFWRVKGILVLLVY